jgi:hypothetical protein
MKQYTQNTLPADAAYIGSSEGPDQISQELDDRLADAIAPAFFKDPDGHRHFLIFAPSTKETP